jgi:16S rRNA A1518/A1519 N6-dimethyltransferase RsmA/KsgA/DIM1 with predicted DNA glycosylase/AP lyase activity
MLIELDRRSRAALAERSSPMRRRHGRAGRRARHRPAALAAATRLKVVGNIPYNITTPIIFHLLERDLRPGASCS